MKVHKAELCGETRAYPSQQQANIALRNHKRTRRCDCGTKAYELEEKEWLCARCNRIENEMKCSNCGLWRHNYNNALPRTELADEIFAQETLSGYDDIDHDIDDEVIENARGVSLQDRGD